MGEIDDLERRLRELRREREAIEYKIKLLRAAEPVVVPQPITTPQ